MLVISGDNIPLTDNSNNAVTSEWVKSYIDSTTKGPYGVEWDANNDVYRRVGATDITQIQRQMKRCILNANGTVNYYLHPTDSTLKADLTAAILDGSAGNVMVEIPKFYYKMYQEGGLRYFMVSPIAVEGYKVHPAFIKSGLEVDFRYYRAYEGYNASGKLLSRSGVVPTRSQTRATFRAQARVNGVGWGITDWNLLMAVQLLYLTEYGDFHSQSHLGSGNDVGSDYGLTTGLSNSIGNGSTLPNSNNIYMSYRGIENFFADIWEFIDGINIQNRVPFISNVFADFADDIFTGSYVSVGVTMPLSSAGYIKDWADTDKGFIPSIVGGSSSTFVPDGFWSIASGNTIALFGGHAVSGALDGAFCLAVNTASSYLDVHVGAGVSF